MRKKQLTVTPETIKHLTLTTEQLGAVVGGTINTPGTSVISQTPGTSVRPSGTSVLTPATSVISGPSVISVGH